MHTQKKLNMHTDTIIRAIQFGLEYFFLAVTNDTQLFFIVFLPNNLLLLHYIIAHTYYNFIRAMSFLSSIYSLFCDFILNLFEYFLVLF